MDPTRTFLDAFRQVDAFVQASASTVPQLVPTVPLIDSLAGSSSGLERLAMGHPIDIGSARHLYTSPSSNVPLTTPSIQNLGIATSTNSASRQCIIDLPYVTPSLNLQRGQQFNEQVPRHQIHRRTHSSTNSAYNQLKETVVRVQQRKRQRENASNQTGYQHSSGPSTASMDNTSTSTPSSSSLGSSQTRRASKVIRRENSDHQAEPTSSTSNRSPSERRCPTSSTNNQQITGPMRQQQHGSCQYCQLHNHPVPQVIPPRIHEMMEPFPAVYAEQTAIPVRRPIVCPVYVPTIVPITPAQTMRPHEMANAIMLLNSYSQPPMMPTVMPSNIITQLVEVINSDRFNRFTMERHHMFTNQNMDDRPVGATFNEIQKNTKKILFDKEKKIGEAEAEEDTDERCTVCLVDFETGKEVRQLKCSHIFHPECIDKWLGYNKKCPVCRNEVDKETSAEVTTPRTAEVPTEQQQ